MPRLSFPVGQSTPRLGAKYWKKLQAVPQADAHGLSLDELDDDLFRTISGDPDMLVDSESLFKMLDNIGSGGLQDSRGHSPNQDLRRQSLSHRLGKS